MIRTLVFATALGALICLAACNQTSNKPQDNVVAQSMPATQDISETAKSPDIVAKGRADADAPYPANSHIAPDQRPSEPPPTLPTDQAGDTPNASTKPQPQ